MYATAINYKINGSEWLSEEDFIDTAYKLLNLKKNDKVVIFPCALKVRLERKGFKITKL